MTKAPLGPIRMALAASRTKARLINSSTASRSQRLGQVQSKSAKGLKRPRWALARRRWRERWVRSCSSHWISGGSQGLVATASQ